MDVKAPPPATSPGSYSDHSHRRSREASLNDLNSSISEKAHYKRNQPPNVNTTIRSRDSVISHPFSPKGSSPPSPSSTTSSGRKHDRRRTSEIQEASQINVTYPPRAHLDLEKQSISVRSPRSATRASTSIPDATTTLYEHGDDNDTVPENKAVELLIYLSGPCALLSFVITFWTFISLAIVTLLQPIRLCSTRPSFREQLITFLAPPLNLQLAMIYSYSSATSYSTPMLLVILLVSPFVAMGVAAAAWIATCFWFFSAILGDPAGQDGHNDGRDSILAVRNWWNRWLSRGLR